MLMLHLESSTTIPPPTVHDAFLYFIPPPHVALHSLHVLYTWYVSVHPGKVPQGPSTRPEVRNLVVLGYPATPEHFERSLTVLEMPAAVSTQRTTRCLIPLVPHVALHRPQGPCTRSYVGHARALHVSLLMGAGPAAPVHSVIAAA